MAITKQSTIQAGELILADAIIAFQEAGVMVPLVTTATAPQGSGTVSFPFYADPASSNVGSGTDGSDYTSTTISIDLQLPEQLAKHKLLSLSM